MEQKCWHNSTSWHPVAHPVARENNKLEHPVLAGAGHSNLSIVRTQNCFDAIDLLSHTLLNLCIVGAAQRSRGLNEISVKKVTTLRK